MALYEQIQDALGNYTPGAGEEISLKIKPAGLATESAPQPSNLTMAPTASATQAGGGGGGAGATPAATPQPVQSIVPGAGQALQRNPQLAGAPAGAYTDAQFEAGRAAAQHQFQQTYFDILQQLGFIGDDGQFVPGLVETQAARQRADLQRSQALAAEGVTQQARRGGTVFSGRRAVNQARAEHPFVQALAQLESELPLTLGNLFQQAQGARSGFEVQLMGLLADAAARQAQAIREQPTAPAPAPAGTPAMTVADVMAALFGPGAGAPAPAAETSLPFMGGGPEQYAGPVYSQLPSGEIVERPQGWLPLPGENLFT